MRTLLKLYKDKKHFLLLIALLNALAAVCSLLLPYQMSKIVNEGVKGEDMNVIFSCGVVMLLLAAASLLVSVLSTKINASVATKFEAELKNKLFEKVNSLSFEQFSSIGTSGLITRITYDVSTLRDLASQGVYAMVNVPITFIGGVILVMLKDVLIGVIMLCVSPIALFFAILIARKLDKLWERADEFTDSQNRLVRERLSGIRVLRAFDKEQEKHEKIASSTKEMVKSYIKANVLSGFINPVASVLLNLATVAILWISKDRIGFQSALTAGDVIAGIQYIGLILNGLLVISWTFAWLPHVGVALRRINEVLFMKEGEESEKTQSVPNASLQISNLCFKYPDSKAYALKNVNLSIQKGEKVAIIGGTGSGKSTLVKLILNFYSPTSGEISLGGVRYSDLCDRAIKQNVSVALQKSMIFQGTVLQNVSALEDNPDEKRALSALTVCQMQDFLNEHEEGLGYALKQSGSNLSGGQKQRINVARAIYKKALLYVFDDSFSALDFYTESMLRSALGEYIKGSSQLIITQRVATAMSCDKICVMSEGETIACGSHEQLLNSCDIYKELYNSQMGGGNNE